jgi:hypothetical protein
MNVCHICGIPQDAGFFDESNIFKLDPKGREGPSLEPGQEVVLARYELHRNYCGLLMYFAQFTDVYANNPAEVDTPGYQWQIRCNGQPRDPYLTFGHIINPWGLSGFPVYLRLEEGCILEFAIRKVGDDQKKTLTKVGGRILGRTWYNTIYGGAPNRL